MPFADIIGHEQQTAYFSRVLDLGTVAHAYVFLGPQGVGKLAVAEHFVAALLGVALKRLSMHPDILVVSRPVDDKTDNKKKQIPIESVRAASDRLALSAVGGRKVVIIDEADTMTVQAQNALLKTLEEPLGEAVLLLLAEDRSRLLPTILSRSVPMVFSRVPTATIERTLKDRGYSDKVAEIAARRSVGRPGAALQLADADVLMQAKKQEEDMAAFLEAPRHERIKMITALVKGDDAQSTDGLQAWLLELCAALHRKLYSGSLAAATGLAALLDAREALRDNGNASLALEHIALSLP